jgi:hypothetical protein
LPFDQRENLRRSILKKKARIAQIERALNAPPPPPMYGRPFRPSQIGRLRLEEEKQELLFAVAEHERELQRLDERPDGARARIPDLLNLSGGWQSPDPVQGNPFRAEDPRYGVWEDATRRAEQELHLWNAAGLRAARELPQPQSMEEAQRIVLGHYGNLVTGKFDIWAKRGIHVVWSDHDIRAFDEWLENYANGWLNIAKELFPPEIETDWLLRELRLLLLGRIEFWKSEARRYVDEQKLVAASGNDARTKARPTRRARLPRSVDPRKQQIAVIKARQQKASARNVCSLMDQTIARQAQPCGPSLSRCHLGSKQQKGSARG